VGSGHQFASRTGRLTNVYDSTIGEIRSDMTNEIACSFIDTGPTVRASSSATPISPAATTLQATLKAEIDEEAWASLYRTRSRPFDPPETGTIAVKVINHHDDEVLKTYDIS
jgi:adenine-specific DNA-methyltransferase